MLHFLWLGYEVREDSYRTYETANDEISKWAEHYLSRKGPFRASHCNVGRVTDSAEDVILGALTWDPERSSAPDWMRENALQPGAAAHPRAYVLTPWVPEFPDEWIRGMPYYESQLLAARRIFALSGDIWITRTFEKNDDSVQVRVRDKLVHLNMGVAAQSFRLPKARFNPIGHRQLLHVSTLGTYKGFDLLCKSLAGMPALLNVGSKKKFPPGMVERTLDDGQTIVFNFLGPIDNSDARFNEWVAGHCDFYIHTASMDAQATTILENCARGLVPIVTPESGFSSAHAIYLTQDVGENRKIIEKALAMPENELMARSRLLREEVEREHDWKNIYGTIWDRIQEDIAADERAKRDA